MEHLKWVLKDEQKLVREGKCAKEKEEHVSMMQTGTLEKHEQFCGAGLQDLKARRRNCPLQKHPNYSMLPLHHCHQPPLPIFTINPNTVILHKKSKHNKHIKVFFLRLLKFWKP